MSGDVQPRKRKDKKKKKDDLGIEEPRGTAAALGEGDIFMHSPNEHGTGGHWCAKVIFFSLLVVLITLVGLIILENRGLSELEANSVESRYSGVLEGWLEEGQDDHHDEHTLELNHLDDEDDDDNGHGLDHGDEHDDDEDHGDELDEELEHDDEDEAYDNDDEDEENDQDDDEEQDNNQEENDEDSQEVNDDSQEADDDDDDDEQNDSEEQNLETAEEDEVEERNYRSYYQGNENQANDDDDDDDDLQKVDDINDGDDQSLENDDEYNQEGYEANEDSQENDDDDEQGQLDTADDDDDNEDSNENDGDEVQENEDEEEHEETEEDSDVEVERIEKEVFDEEVSTEEPEDDKSEENSEEASPVNEADDDDVEFLEPGDLDDLPDELPIPLPKGKPLAEVEDSSTETPQDTLADEEEYERQQEALRQEKEQTSQGMWLKLVVGGALLVATQAVLRRATAPREPEDEVDTTREATPLSDRRMTLIAEPVAPPVIPKPQEVPRPVVQEEVRQAPVVKSTPPPPPEEEYDEEVEDEEEEEDIVVTKNVEPVSPEKDTVNKELYSDEEEYEDEEEEIVEEKKEPPKPIVSKPASPIKEAPKSPVIETPKPIEKKEAPKPVEKEPTPEEEYEDDDVEIIEDEDVEEEEEDDISDVDDVELLSRLEAKYGRLPEPERPGRKTEGGNSIEDEWPGEPSDAYWRDELDQAERDLRQGEWTAATRRASATQLGSSARARYITARALDSAAEAKRDNGLLTKAIAAYLELLKMNERLSDEKLREVTNRALDRIQFRGNYLGAEPVYRLLIRRFPDDPTHRNNLTVSFLMANRVDLAEEVIKETLTRWPNDRLALAHHGFILKTLHNRVEEAVDAFTKALEGDAGPANEPRFYYHLGDSLLLLGRFKEAHEVHKRGAKLGHFLSPAQRSLYNVDRLKSEPWWDVEKTPYTRLARALEKSWKEILKEGRVAQALYEKEKEGLKESGEWSQLELFSRGREVRGRCARAPAACGAVRAEAAAAGCRRGQVKFSSMEPGTHVRPHVGPTNCRLRMHLGLSNTKDTYIRVDQETRQWQTGKVLMFDDSFEHEVWHNGTGTRLVLIVDVWHPDLTPNERKQLPAI